MKNRWNKNDASNAVTDLELRAYSSRLLGKDSKLVLHGGGNTSLKSTRTNRFGQEENLIWVKASGFDLKTMGTEGFTGLHLEKVVQLAELSKLADQDMVNDLLCARINPEAAKASIEAVVHGLIPYKYVDHTHADAVLTISNSPKGSEILKEIYTDKVIILTYIKPGFDLALQFKTIIDNGAIENCEAVILEHHGVFTFAEDAKQSYDKMIDIVQVAEDYLTKNIGELSLTKNPTMNPKQVAEYRKMASTLAGKPLVSRPAQAVPKKLVINIGKMLRNGTLTPEHVLHNKPFPAMATTGDAELDLLNFSKEYKSYFDRAADPSLEMLAPYPHWAIFSSGEARSYGNSLKRAVVSADVANSTLNAMLYANEMGGWSGLTEQDLRDLEYWELEQAKLKKQGKSLSLQGKIAVVAGSATGIGLATAKILAKNGAVVVGFDINPEVKKHMNRVGFDSIIVDLTDGDAVKQAIENVVENYGGIDILIANAGIFKAGEYIENLQDDTWDKTLEINLTAHRKLLSLAIPYLRLGVDPSIAFVASRNCLAPGAGASAYSVSKAGLTQLARVAALELCQDKIRVNIVHPDAVFDTPLWDGAALKKSAKRYGMSVKNYKLRNLLKVEISSNDVAKAILAFSDDTFSKTTGAQVPVDGGSDRVI